MVKDRPRGVKGPGSQFGYPWFSSFNGAVYKWGLISLLGNTKRAAVGSMWPRSSVPNISYKDGSVFNKKKNTQVVVPLINLKSLFKPILKNHITLWSTSIAEQHPVKYEYKPSLKLGIEHRQAQDRAYSVFLWGKYKAKLLLDKDQHIRELGNQSKWCGDLHGYLLAIQKNLC